MEQRSTTVVDRRVPGRVTWRVALALATALAVVAAACTSGDGQGGEQGGAAPAGSVPAAPGTAASADQPADGGAGFVPPAGVVAIDYPTQPPDVPWPTDGWPEGPIPPEVDAAALNATLDAAVGELSTGELANTDAVLVVHRGRIVAERYRPGFGDRDTVHRSWSMAKSFTQALAGVLVRDGRLDIYAPADVPEWSDPADPRHAITVDQLLRMANGLEWKEEYFAPDSDTVAMLNGVGAGDMAHYAADKPLEVPPDSRVRYSTGTSNIVAGVIGRQVGTGDAYRAFVTDELLDPLGIDPDHTNIGFDGVGNLVGGSVFDLTARDFARFGLLYARGGEWDGTRIVPQSWVDYGRTPTPPPAGTEEYGAHWWTYENCPSGFRAGGFNGQHIVVCPTLDLVVVVLSNRVDGKDGQIRDDVVDAFRGVPPAT